MYKSCSVVMLSFLLACTDCSKDQREACEELTDLLKNAAENPPKSMVQ